MKATIRQKNIKLGGHPGQFSGNRLFQRGGGDGTDNKSRDDKVTGEASGEAGSGKPGSRREITQLKTLIIHSREKGTII